MVQGFNLMMCYYKPSEDDKSIDAQGWLHTGDLGTLQADGYLKLTGRIKKLIIRGGENIMPGDFFDEEVCACIKLKAGGY